MSVSVPFASLVYPSSEVEAREEESREGRVSGRQVLPHTQSTATGPGHAGCVSRELTVSLTYTHMELLWCVCVGLPVHHWVMQRSWFARVSALCNLSRKKSREVAACFRDDF